MPKIQWERLPREEWAHLRDRAKERKISEEDLFELAEWKAQDPDVPDGDWYREFGSFKLCGKGKYPSTLSDVRTSRARHAFVRGSLRPVDRVEKAAQPVENTGAPRIEGPPARGAGPQPATWQR
jgi:hypothetical protein